MSFWLQTFTGKAVDLFEPRTDQMDIRDVAHALAMQCRFNGHTREFYSVAEHSVRVAIECFKRSGGLRTAFVAGLLHDAAEAYVGDMVQPLKRGFEIIFGLQVFRATEERIQTALLRSLHMSPGARPMHEELVKDVDVALCATEARDLLGVAPRPWNLSAEPLAERIERTLSPSEAESLFFRAWNASMICHQSDLQAIVASLTQQLRHQAEQQVA